MNLTYNQIEIIAQICHEANRAYCQSIGDDTQLPWDLAHTWQKESAIAGVKLALDPNTKPSDSHESWMAKKLAEGWRYGETKSADTKEHPCLVPYNQLPESQRRKDHIFLAVARGAAAALSETL